MIESLFFLVLILLVPTALAWFWLGGNEGKRFALLIAVMGILYLCLLWFINSQLPFTEHGDDQGYYYDSLVTFSSSGDWFNFAQFSHIAAQPGYPLVLAWTHQFIGDSLYLRKALNISFFLCLAVIWFEIGRRCGGPRTGYIFGISILLGAPLWYHWVFLLKDMLITLLQSILVLALTGVVTARNVGRHYAIAALATLAVMPFRMQLMILNAFLIILVALQVYMRSRRPDLKRIVILVMGIGVGIFIILSAQNSDLISRFGVDETRQFSVEGYVSTVEKTQIGGGIVNKYLLFPIAYLLGEVTVFTGAWSGAFDSSLLRGIGNALWIFAGLPFFLIGFYYLVFHIFHRNPQSISADLKAATLLPHALSWKGPWFSVLLFFTAYFCLSWAVSDTTRYRIPGFPALLSIAALGWIVLNPQKRLQLFTGWTLTVATTALIYYSLVR